MKIKLILTLLFFYLNTSYGFIEDLNSQLFREYFTTIKMQDCYTLEVESQSLQYYGNIYFKYKGVFYAITYPLNKSSLLYRHRKVFESYNGNYSKHSFECDITKNSLLYILSLENNSKNSFNHTYFYLDKESSVIFYKPEIQKIKSSFPKSIFAFSAYNKIIRNCKELDLFLNQNPSNRMLYFKYKDFFYKTFAESNSPLFVYKVNEELLKEIYDTDITFKKFYMQISEYSNARYIDCQENQLRFNWIDSANNKSIRTYKLDDLHFYSNQDDDMYYPISTIHDVLKIPQHYTFRLNNCDEYKDLLRNGQTIEDKIFFRYNKQYFFFYSETDKEFTYIEDKDSLGKNYWRLFDKVYLKPICREVDGKPTLKMNPVQVKFDDPILLDLSKVEFYRESTPQIYEVLKTKTSILQSSPYHSISLFNCKDYEDYIVENENMINGQLFFQYLNDFYSFSPKEGDSFLYKASANTKDKEEFWDILDNNKHKIICEEINSEATLTVYHQHLIDKNAILSFKLKDLKFYKKKPDIIKSRDIKITTADLTSRVNLFDVVTLNNCRKYDSYIVKYENTIDRKIFFQNKKVFYFFYFSQSVKYLYMNNNSKYMGEYWIVFDKIYYNPTCVVVNNEPKLHFYPVNNYLEPGLEFKLDQVKFYRIIPAGTKFGDTEMYPF